MASKSERQTIFREAGAAWMQAQNEKILKYLAGTIAGEDPEELHDMRVASRRLRAAMLVFRACFPTKAYQTWYRHVSGITEALGAVRDMDVQREAVVRRRDAMPEELRGDVDHWLESLQSQRDEARVHMIAALEQWRDVGMSERLASVLERVGDPAIPIRNLAREAGRRLLGLGEMEVGHG